ncbi:MULTISPECIES: GIY-YIG nuclease family protein [Nostoc]|uniref:GIY-YIG nuclease family protein n=1 Tax=Nostoc paludosum FACHB-159 TaxID=2692908 RepID=A0ABR8KJ33_9NOSO|nr:MULTISPECIES: GIY-YIG nuclease family protein [Nostoc]MBD2682408.1 GIY-YIG nuclease family protein [Nostoc sp. FACHB-857]MBD2738766.1 GIY-YIG nuclease family protein [Nostoc paludosum FACHB-159]
MTTEPNQLNLFSDVKSTLAPRAKQLVMSEAALLKWKSRILAHQQQLRQAQPLQQTSLFDLTPKHCDPDTIDPLTLQLVPMSFYRRPVDGSGEACLYFILDSAVELVLYVGETCRSNKRWKGIHDCKDYIASYQDLHSRYGLTTAVNAAFWWDAPVDRRARQQLELELILKWRSPFNKENWDLWGQPFK